MIDVGKVFIKCMAIDSSKAVHSGEKIVGGISSVGYVTLTATVDRPDSLPVGG